MGRWVECTYHDFRLSAGKWIWPHHFQSSLFYRWCPDERRLLGCGMPEHLVVAGSFGEEQGVVSIIIHMRLEKRTVVTAWNR